MKVIHLARSVIHRVNVTCTLINVNGTCCSKGHGIFSVARPPTTHQPIPSVCVCSTHWLSFRCFNNIYHTQHQELFGIAVCLQRTAGLELQLLESIIWRCGNTASGDFGWGHNEYIFLVLLYPVDWLIQLNSTVHRLNEFTSSGSQAIPGGPR